MSRRSLTRRPRGNRDGCEPISLVSPRSTLQPEHKCCESKSEHNKTVTLVEMNSKQLKRWLEQQGATFQPGKGSHLKVLLNGRQSTLPMHGTSELGKGLESAIKRQLGLK